MGYLFLLAMRGGKAGFMKRKSFALFAAAISIISMVGCNRSTDGNTSLDTARETVELTVWGAEEDEALLNQIISSFEQQYQGEADFRITFAVQGESDCKDILLAGLEEGADVFTFVDDQLNALAAAGAVDPIENADSIRSENLSTSVEAASVNGTLYAYPLTADNSYFLYYNKEYFSEEDVQTLDGILAVAEAAEKNSIWTGPLPGMYIPFSAIPVWRSA